MRNKIIGILICIMMIATIPLAAGTLEEEPDSKPTAIFERALIAGVFFRLLRVGDYYHGQCIRLRWYEIGPGDRAGGVYSFPDIVVFKETIGSFYKVFQFGLGLFTIVFGVAHNLHIY